MKQTAGTTFASAASPLYTKSHKRTSRPDAPLLGVSSQTQSTKKVRLDSFGAFRSGSSPKMFALPSSCKPRSLGKVQRKSITRFLTKVSLKVKRGKFVELKPQQPDEFRPIQVISDYYCGSFEESGSMSYKNCVAESRYSLDEEIFLSNRMESDADDSMSFTEEKKLDTNTRLTPLSFDDTQVTNHFRTSSRGVEFSFHKALSPRIISSSTSQEAHALFPPGSLDDMLPINSLMSLDLEDFRSLPPDVNISHSKAAADEVPHNSSEGDVNRRKFDEILDIIMSTPPRTASTRCSLTKKNHSLPRRHSSSDESDVVQLPETAQIDTTDGREDSMNRDQMRRFDSSDSIPSLSGDADALDQTPADNINPLPTSTKDAADSTIAWGCLAALLGSPAPSSARKQKKRTPVNLWQYDTYPDEDLDAICLLQNDKELVNEMQTLNLVANDDDDWSIPLCEDLVREVDDSFGVDVPTTPTRVKSIADSTLAWGVLGAILGSPAPLSVLKKNCAPKKQDYLWNNCEENDLPPEIEGRDDVDDECDVLCAPIDLTELVEADEQVNILTQSIELQGGDRRDESVESVFAWTALGMLMGSPAPRSVCKKRRKESKVVAKNLWIDFESIGDDVLETVPCISPDEEDYSLNTECRLFSRKWLDAQDLNYVPSLSITPSLSGTSDEEDVESL
ncbi:hypothetical protein ACHAXA_007438 [Cyclostephanos tholiformis]|uniref:Uncharacterized protein n=1 Tax=Cyclostephanos tholiformis TaxID=382380 RepID=A0ABD3SDE6_9STRA